MHTDVTMTVKAWKGRRSDHSCSESDNFVSVSCVCLSGYLPPKARSCFDLVDLKKLGIVSFAYITVLKREEKKNWEIYDFQIQFLVHPKGAITKW